MIKLKTPEEIEIIAKGGRILSRVMEELSQEVKPGISTKELDRVAETLIFKYGGQCAFKGYHGFPACLCVSVNEEVVHSVPSNRLLKSGDIITLDLGVLLEGFNTDMAITVPVGDVSKNTMKLVNVAKEALAIGINEVAEGKYFGDIGSSVQKYVQKNGFSIVKNLCGHGIGRELHEDPFILNYGKAGSGLEIKEGMVFCIEPIIAEGRGDIKNASDGFGFETQDGLLSAHFEHTIAVTKEGVKVLTSLGA